MKSLLIQLLLIPFFVLSVFQAKAKSQYPIDISTIKVDDLLWDLHKLSEAPSFIWHNEKNPVHSLSFEGLIYKGKPTRVFAYYSNPELLRGIKSDQRKFPGIILVHGGGGKAFKEWVEKWAADGFAALAVDVSSTGGTKINLMVTDRNRVKKRSLKI